MVQIISKLNKMAAILAETIGKWNKMAAIVSNQLENGTKRWTTNLVDHSESKCHSKLEPKSTIRNLNMFGIQALYMFSKLPLFFYFFYKCCHQHW